MVLFATVLESRSNYTPTCHIYKFFPVKCTYLQKEGCTITSLKSKQVSISCSHDVALVRTRPFKCFHASISRGSLESAV